MTLRLVHPAPPPKPKPPARRRRPVFSPEEQARLRAALKHARALLGTWPCLADAMGVNPRHLEHCIKGTVTPEIAVRLARALGKPVESLYRPLSDARICPTCGRGKP